MQDKSKVRLSKDKMLENAILNSVGNPRHCLYFREANDPNIIAKTLLNANETYELRFSPTYALSIHAHEQIHIVSTNQTQFKRIILLNSVCPSLEMKSVSKTPVKITSSKSMVDFLLLYNSEVIPYLEAFAIMYQCKLKETPFDMKSALIDELSVKNPGLYGLVIDIEDVFERIAEKNKSAEIEKAQVFALLGNLVFSSPDIVNQRVFDRFRLLREAQRIPEWRTFREIASFFTDYLHDNKQDVIITTLGTDESIIETAQFMQVLKELTRQKGIKIPQTFLFGVLSEFDMQIGRISYFVDNLETLEGKAINHCYLGDIAKTNNFLSALKLVLNNTNELIEKEKFHQHLELLKEFRKDITSMLEIKEKVFRKCPGAAFCTGKTRCLIKETLCHEINERLFLQKDHDFIS